MVRLAHLPPVVGFALALGAGATLRHLGVPFLWTLASLLALSFLKQPWHRPGRFLSALGVALLSGFLLTGSWIRGVERDCRFDLREGEVIRATGWLAGPLVGGMGEIRPDGSGPAASRCRRPIRLLAPGPDGLGLSGGRIVIRGRWRKSPRRGDRNPMWAGYLRVDSAGVAPGGRSSQWRGVRERITTWVRSSAERLYPETSSLVLALVWARKDGLDRSVREAFSRAGVAHLLAISGFHVGVVAGVLFLLLGLMGGTQTFRFVASGIGVWIYVVTIGLPDAASRAAVLLSLLTVGRIANRAVHPLGALATAFLGLLLFDPGALTRPGFQLSFAGATGLVLGYRPISEGLDRLFRKRIPSGLLGGIGAGAAATLATLPLVAWHFGRISLVGIPVTLLATPLIVLAIPGIFLSLLLLALGPGPASVVASGVEVVLLVLLEIVQRASALPMASLWVPHNLVLLGTGALAVVGVLALSVPGMMRGPRGRILFLSGVTVFFLGPPGLLLLERGSLELVVLDVGQGDASLIRSPGGRWILVDAGPSGLGDDAGEQTVVPFLRGRGVSELEFMILTHPDMDHVGGASSVLEEMDVGAVLDPGMPAGTEAFLGALETARARGIPWRVLQAGDSINLDGMVLRVLAPEGEGEGREEDGANRASIVLEVRFGAFSALLTGDAPAESETRFLPRTLSPRINVLKVGHHGSSTSTSPGLLRRINPEVALISVGRRNRFGHPTAEVISRLRNGGTRIFRTDQVGALVVRAQEDGRFSVSHDGL